LESGARQNGEVPDYAFLKNAASLRAA
jgi:hypothetical protein